MSSRGPNVSERNITVRLEPASCGSSYADSTDRDERQNAHWENRWALEDLSAGS